MSKGMLPLKTGDHVAEDIHIPFMIGFQYHETCVLASNKKTVLTHLFYPSTLIGKRNRLDCPHNEIVDGIA
jgi:hypothetical protein